MKAQLDANETAIVAMIKQRIADLDTAMRETTPTYDMVLAVRHTIAELACIGIDIETGKHREVVK